MDRNEGEKIIRENLETIKYFSNGASENNYINLREEAEFDRHSFVLVHRYRDLFMKKNVIEVNHWKF